MPARSRILAVDDDSQNLVLFEELLGEDYQLHTLDGGDRVLDTMRTFRPDLVLLDIMMPDINGYDVCRLIRSDTQLRRTKVMLVSAKSRVKERLQGYDAGADDYIAKPFALDELLAKVRVHLRLKSVEELDDLKNQFLTLLSHETRTPLTTIISAAEMLAGDEALPRDRQEKLTEMILEGARRMHRLLDRLNLLSRVRSGEKRFEQSAFDLEEAVEFIVPSVIARHRAADIEVRIQASDGAAAVGDPASVHMILEAILDNAVRFSPAGSEVLVEVSKVGDRTRIAISDQGPGIEQRLLARIWDGFLVGDLSHHQTGHGISLALAHGMIMALGGSIDIESVPGQGTSVIVTLPALDSFTSEQQARAA